MKKKQICWNVHILQFVISLSFFQNFKCDYEMIVVYFKSNARKDYLHHQILLEVSKGQQPVFHQIDSMYQIDSVA